MNPSVSLNEANQRLGLAGIIAAHPSASGARRERLFSRLDAREITLVRRLVARSRHPVLRSASVCISELGNGWLYLAVAVLTPALAGRESWRCLLAGAISAGLSILLYTSLKERLARPRPCDYDRALTSRVRVLDRYSFPSGHCMNAAAVGVPLGLAFPAAALAVVAVWLLLAWSRVSLGHHYVSDIVGGGALGVGISLAVSSLVL